MRASRMAGRLLLVVFALPAAYVAVALAGTLVPDRAGRPFEGERTVTIYAIATPIHTDLVLPMRVAGVDLSPLVAEPAFSADAATVEVWREAVPYVAVSWGSRAFFTGVPTWDAMRPRHVLDALIDDSAVHLTLVERPWDVPGVVALEVGLSGYRRLAATIDAALVGGLDGPVPLAGMGYFDSDGFYAGTETYHAFRTCNVWIGDALADAGVTVARWTPHPQGLMWSLRRSPSANPSQGH